MRVTTTMLENLNACSQQVEIFRAEWPEGCEITKQTVLRAVELKLDIEWAAENLLSKEAFRSYQKARAPHWNTYQEACAPHLKAYNEAVAPLYKAYEEACAPHLKAYEEACAPHYKTYNEACVQLYKAYQEARAIAFLEACQK